MQLAHQVSETAKSHSRARKGHTGGRAYKPSQDEYLSGFYKTDKLIPVVTLTIFYSAEKRDGPLTLREMYSAADDAVMQYVPDYRINLIAPGDMPEEEIGEFQSSLKEVLLYIKYSKDKEKLQEVMQKNKNFRSLERQAAEVIRVTTNSKLKYQEGREVNISLQDTIQRIAEKFNLSLQKSEEEVKKYWK